MRRLVMVCMVLVATAGWWFWGSTLEPVRPSPNTAFTLYLTVPNHALPLCVEMATVAWMSHHQFGVPFIRMERAAQSVVNETLRHLVR